MTPEQVLSYPPRVLTQAQREFYFEHGYVLLESIVPEQWLPRLQAAAAELIERSRGLARSDQVYDLEDGHSAENPKLRRVTNANEAHPTFWEYISQSLVADMAADLVGPNVKFTDSNFNFKWAGGGEEIKWHQDAQYAPHTNYSQVTFATMLDDVGPDQAPMTVLSGSPRGRALRPLRRQRRLDRDDLGPGPRAGRSGEGGPSDRSGGHDPRPQLPDHPRLGAQRFGAQPAAPSDHIHGRGCVRIQAARPPPRAPLHARAGGAGALGPSRSAPEPDSAGLVTRPGLSFHLHLAAERAG